MKKFNQQISFKLLSWYTITFRRKTMLYAQKICILFLALKRLYFDWNVVYLYVPIFIILNTDQIGKKISGIPCNYKKCKIYPYWILNNNFVWEKFHRFIFVRCAYSSLNLNASFFEKKDKLVKFHTKIKDKSFHAV